MNILVCIKQVPASSKVEVDPQTGVLKRAGVESKMNPYDLYALETALRLPSYVKLCASRERPVTVLTLDDMDDRDERHYGLNGSPTQVRRIFPPESDVRREIWRGSGQTLGARLYTMLRQKKFV